LVADSQIEYTDDIITALQWIWGDGFLAPGGPEEVAEMLQGLDLEGYHVLDVGSGLGSIDALLVEKYNVQSVIGIDVEPHLIKHACQRVDDLGLNERVSFQLVEPGPLPFNDNYFDMVFSKDSIVHIHDKVNFYEDVMRVLKPGGVFVGSDWLCAYEETHTKEVKEYLKLVNLTYHMQTPKQTSEVIVKVGFEKITLRDRNKWYQKEVKNELNALSGYKLTQLADLIGQDQAEYRLKVSSIKQQVIEQGFLRPTHIRGYKPSVNLE
jgi:ubiquinone/menaquinone biosynthesis C-methylase UbiE